MSRVRTSIQGRSPSSERPQYRSVSVHELAGSGRPEVMPDLGLLRPLCGLAPFEPSEPSRISRAFALVSAMFPLAPPARFELALPPSESQRTMIWHDWNLTKPQVSPDFDALALLAVSGRFRFWCCQSVAKAPSRSWRTALLRLSDL
jgi:hypothetical protein